MESHKISEQSFLLGNTVDKSDKDDVVIEINPNIVIQSDRYKLENKAIVHLISNYLAYNPDLFHLRLVSRAMNYSIETSAQGELARLAYKLQPGPVSDWLCFTRHPTLEKIGACAYFVTVVAGGFSSGAYIGHRIIENGGDIVAAICGGGFSTVMGFFATAGVTSVGALPVAFLCQKIGLFAQKRVDKSYIIRKSLEEVPRNNFKFK